MARASARRSTRRKAAISSSVATPASIRCECRLALRRLLLASPHPGINAATEKQIPMVATLDNTSAVEHEDLVGIDEQRQPVRDDEGRAVGGDLGEARLDLAL